MGTNGSGDLGGSEWRFDVTRDLLCVADAEGRFVSLNGSWERVLGWSREALMSRPFIEFVHPDDVERTRAAAARVTERDFALVNFENRYLSKDGTYRWLRWSAHADGSSWFAIAYDVTERKRREEDLRHTLTEDHLLAYSQPIMDQRSRQLDHEELLVRLQGEGEGNLVMAPDTFVPDAERLGLIPIVDRWMLRQALAIADTGRCAQVNLSACSIADEDLVADAEEAIRAAPQAAPNLIFEITETAAIENLEAARDFTDRMLPLGCSFALDDFGTGFGSLTYLRRLPVSYLKIDTSFVTGMLSDHADQALVRSVIAIARELGLESVAEGVEDEWTLQMLRDFGVDHVQGFLIGRPQPLAA